MPRLLHDRYLEYAPDRAWDLVTGDSLTNTSLALPHTRDARGLAPLIEVLEHGRDGTPRWIATDAQSRGLRFSVASAAAEASARGYVPVAVDVYLRLRRILVEELRDRALVLIARP